MEAKGFKVLSTGVILELEGGSTEELPLLFKEVEEILSVWPGEGDIGFTRGMKPNQINLTIPESVLVNLKAELDKFTE